MTTLDIIKTLPLDKDLRTRILQEYDLMVPDQKFSLERVVWKSYFMIFENKLEENLELASQEIREGNGKIGDDFYKRAVKKTEEQLKSRLDHENDNVDLTEARKAMEVIIKEIQASKKSN